MSDLNGPPITVPLDHDTATSNGVIGPTLATDDSPPVAEPTTPPMRVWYPGIEVGPGEPKMLGPDAWAPSTDPRPPPAPETQAVADAPELLRVEYVLSADLAPRWTVETPRHVYVADSLAGALRKTAWATLRRALGW